MPIYEYVCPGCDLKFELLRRLSQSGDKAVCPRCGKDSEKVLSTFCSMTKDESGMVSALKGGGSSCASCGGGSCSTCGH